MKKSYTVIILCLFISMGLNAQEDKKEKAKSGWSFGAVPAIAYDSDTGFKYGGLVNFYHYGDGTIYPKYKHSLYFEWSRTTKGSGINQFTYDSEYLIPGIRVTAEASLLTEKALDFYGFNGYQALYNSEYENDENVDEYISRMYYRHERRLTRIKADFQGKIIGRKLRWYGGLAHYGVDVASVDTAKLNEGKPAEERLPSVNGLYDNYVDWGIIPENQKDGGSVNYLKAGLVWDTRDNEPNPNRGMWTEAFLLMAPKVLGNKDYSYGRIALTHRQYFTILKNRLTFAYRLGYQAKLWGDMPFYMLPFEYNTKMTRDGVGGSKTVRGVLRNRIVGEDYLYGNFEFRLKVLRTVVFNQNLYIALNPFVDFGLVTTPWKFAESQNMEVGTTEKPHIGYGMGVRFALNQNFIVAVDYGLAASEQDGNSGLYIGLNYLF